MLAPNALDHRALGPLPATPGRFLWLFIRRRFPGRILLMVLAAGGAMALMGVEPVAMGHIIDTLTAGTKPGDGGGDGGWPDTVVFWYVLLGVAWVVSGLLNRASDVINLYTLPALRFEIQAVLFSYLLDHSPRYFQENLSGKLGQKVTQAGHAATELIHVLFFSVVRILVIVGVGMVAIAPDHGGIAAVLLVWTSFFLGVSLLLARRCQQLSHASSEETSTVSGRMVDALANIELVRAFARKTYERSRLSEAFLAEFDSSKRLRWYMTFVVFVQLNCLLLFQLTMVGLTVTQVVAGRLSAGEIALAFSLSGLVGWNVFGLSNQILAILEHFGTLSSVLTQVLQPHEIPDLPAAPRLQPTRGAIAIEGLRFAHVDGSPVFDGLDLDIRGGEKVALVGPSGAGKSTLVKLLRRQFVPQAGRIVIDGQDISCVSLDSLNTAIAEVPQDPSLFHRSIRENIGYARPDLPDAHILDAAGKAHCDGFIRQRPDGYDSVVGERGVRLSGGERQRVAIARAFLKDAPILVLDEATSALDSETERLIQDALWQLFQGRTVMAVAHRLSTITGMDRILVMEHGRIIEQGNHAQLLNFGGTYARLWQRQAGGFIP